MKSLLGAILLITNLCNYSHRVLSLQQKPNLKGLHGLFASRRENVDKVRHLDLIFADSDVKLVTPIIRFEKQIPAGAVVSIRDHSILVDLYGMVHVADPSYYAEIEKMMLKYDLVLYELITSNGNTVSNGFKRSLKRNLLSPDGALLASAFQLQSQLEGLNLLKPNWYIADIDSESLRKLELPRKKLIRGQYWLSQIGGRANANQLLKNFFLSDKSIVTALRIICWLAPCPELTCLLIDWSRMYPNAGGLPLVIEAIVENLLVGRTKDAQKLAFAQQLLSGIPDSGGWGGETQSDLQVRVSARNAECCRILEAFANEHNLRQQQETLKKQRDIENLVSGTSKVEIHGIGAQNDLNIEPDNCNNRDIRIAVLYGSYHLRDLTERFVRMGYEYSPKRNAVEYLTAWTIPRKRAMATTTNSPIQTIPRAASSNSARFLAGAAAAAAALPEIHSDSATLAQENYDTHYSPNTNSGQAVPAADAHINFSAGIEANSVPSTPQLLLVAAALLYLIAGALDWGLLIYLLTRVIEVHPTTLAVPLTLTPDAASLSTSIDMGATLSTANPTPNSFGYILSGWPKGFPILDSYAHLPPPDYSELGRIEPVAASLEPVHSPPKLSEILREWVGSIVESGDVIFSLFYVAAYVQRHLFLLKWIGSVGIQWDRGLFEDDLRSKNRDNI